MTRLALFLSLLAACTDFDELDRGVCGNGVVEAGEDCDSPADTCVRCAITCTAAADCAEGAACGVDGTCRTPSGAFGDPGAPVSFEVDDFRVTRVDDDAYADAVGISSTQLAVRFGGTEAGAPRTQARGVRAPLGVPAFSSLATGIVAALATEDGIAAYARSGGALAPVPQRLEFGAGEGSVLSAFPLTPKSFGFLLGSSADVVIAVFAPFEENVVDIPAVRACQARLPGLTDATVDRSSVRSFAASDSAQVVSFRTLTGQLCVTAIHKNLLGPRFDFTDITPAAATSFSQPPILIDLSPEASARCPGLLRVEPAGTAAAFTYWPGKQTNDRCTFDPPAAAPIPQLAAAAGARPVGRIQYARGSLVGFANDVLVLSTGVYAYAPGDGFSEVYRAARPIASVSSGDIDNDGLVDAALGTTMEDDVTVLRRVEVTLFEIPLYDTFQVYRLDTTGFASSVALADLDGNGASDLVYTEAAGSQQRLMVAYGTRDRPLPPVQLSALASVPVIVAGVFPDSVDPSGTVADLIVVEPTLSPARVTILQGDTERTLSSFLDARDDEDPALSLPGEAATVPIRAGTSLRGVAIGRFTSAMGDAPDVLQVATVRPPLVGAGEARAFLLAGEGDNVVARRDPGVRLAMTPCPGGGTACLADTLFAAVPVSADRDAVLAIDRGSAMAVLYDPPAFSARPIDALAQLAPDGAVREVHVAELGGGASLLVPFAPRDGQPAHGHVLACELDGGAPTACRDLAQLAVAQLGVDGCIDAAPARLDGGTDVIALCARGTSSVLVRIRGLEAVTELWSGPRLDGLQIGDLTGDGLDDLAATSGARGSRTLVVLPQCATRDLACTGGAP